MSRRTLIAGNWKMNLRRESAVALARGVVDQLPADAAADVALCPPNVYLAAVAEIVNGSPVGLGAQNCYYESDGAFTGEVNAAMLKDIGCKYVILGHSERRQYFAENDKLINKKLHAVLAEGLRPIVCVGELLEQREAGQTESVVEDQINGSLADLSADQLEQTVVAYEPVWAIGTGKVATPDQAEAVHAHIRQVLRTSYGDVADSVIIQYGGSVKPGNAGELLQQPNIDGALVGGASLKIEDFLGIVAAVAK